VYYVSHDEFNVRDMAHSYLWIRDLLHRSLSHLHVSFHESLFVGYRREPIVLHCITVCCSMLQQRNLLKYAHSQCVAVCCSVWQWVAVCFSALRCVAVCCSVLQCVATEKPRQVRTLEPLQRAATHCNTLQHTATHCNTLQRTAGSSGLEFSYFCRVFCCNTLQYDTLHCNTLQHTATHYQDLWSWV